MNGSLGMSPGSFVYERRASTLTDPIAAGTSGYRLLYWIKPSDMPHFLLFGVGTDQHLDSSYRWVVDDVELPISGVARVGTPQEPYIFPEPIYVSGYVALYVTNGNSHAYPNNEIDDPDGEYGYECLIIGRYG